MPFTLSHPAAVLPLLRAPFNSAALVAGAVAPDMPYFVGAVVTANAQSWYEPLLNATTSHTPAGVIMVDLPYALALCGLYGIARRPVEAVLPGVTGSRWPGRPGDLRTLIVRGGWVLLSALLGILTHLVWDSVTHGDGNVVALVPVLSDPVAGDVTWARLLQHVSTVGGLVAIAVYLWRRRTRWSADATGSARPTGSPRSAGRHRLAALAVIGVIAFAGAAANAGRRWQTPDSAPAVRLIEGVLTDAAKGAGAALVAAVILYTVGWWAARALSVLRRPRRTSS